ncbi:MAG: TatD family hydrolase [Methanosarcinales archaeon]|nr:TatD family hydrolase [Methanosarcinales archaeon]
MLIDTHAHVNFNAYRLDADKVIKKALKNNVWLINVGAGFESSRKAIEIAEKYSKGVYATVGLHPIHAEENFCIVDYKDFTKSEKVIAIGEIGLDYKSEYVSFKEHQKQVFLEQLNLAKELNLPIIFHCRFAHQDLIEILKLQVLNFKPQGVVHCFAGNWKEAEKYLDMGLYLGFNGIIFKLNLDEIIRKTPLGKILIETDCPYLTPPQESGRNEPLHVKYVAEKIAEIKNISYKEVVTITTQNAKDLFKI